MSDQVVRATALGGAVRVVAVTSTGVARALRLAHDAGPLGAVALSRLATATLLLGATIKGRQQIGIQINGDGPLGELYAIADAKGHVRATVADARVDLPLAGGLAPGIGMGRFAVIKRLDPEDPPYRGVVPIVYGEVGRDLAEYLLSSEQIRSIVAVGERVEPSGFSGAAGYMVQALPGADERALGMVEAQVAGLPPLGDLVADGDEAQDLLGRLFDDLEVLERYPAAMRCNCNRQRYARILVSLGTEELTRLAVDQEVTETRCHFCGAVYTFDREQIGALVYGAGLKEK